MGLKKRFYSISASHDNKRHRVQTYTQIVVVNGDKYEAISIYELYIYIYIYICICATTSQRPLFFILCVQMPIIYYWSSEEVEDADSSDLLRSLFVGEGLGLLVVDEATGDEDELASSLHSASSPS